MTSILQAGRIRRGEMKPSRVTRFAAPDIRAIRRRLHQSQAEFARMIGVSIAISARRRPPDPAETRRQGRRRPAGAARALLKIATVNPQAVAEAMAS